MKRSKVYRAIIAALLVLIALLLWDKAKTTRLLKIESDNLTAINAKLSELKPSNNDEKISQALTALRDELIRYRAEQQLNSTDSSQELSATIDQALATITDPSVVSPYEPLVKVAQLKADWKSVDVYQLAKSGSKIIGQAIANQSYIVEETQTGWHKLRLDSQKSGWIQDQFINEIN